MSRKYGVSTLSANVELGKDGPILTDDNGELRVNGALVGDVKTNAENLFTNTNQFDIAASASSEPFKVSNASTLNSISFAMDSDGN